MKFSGIRSLNWELIFFFPNFLIGLFDLGIFLYLT